MREEEDDVHEVGTMGECSGEDAVEEAVPHHGVVPQPDPDCPVEPRDETTKTRVSRRSK